MGVLGGEYLPRCGVGNEPRPCRYDWGATPIDHDSWLAQGASPDDRRVLRRRRQWDQDRGEDQGERCSGEPAPRRQHGLRGYPAATEWLWPGTLSRSSDPETPVRSQSEGGLALDNGVDGDRDPLADDDGVDLDERKVLANQRLANALSKVAQRVHGEGEVTAPT